MPKKIIAIILTFILFWAPSIVLAEEDDYQNQINALKAEIAFLREVLIQAGIIEETITQDLSSGYLGNGAYVSITDARLGKSEFGTHCIYITYNFSHNNAEPMDFFSSTFSQAFQGESDIPLANLDMSNSGIYPVEKDELIEVIVVYALTDMENSVRVEMIGVGVDADKELINLSKVFNLGDLQ